MDGKPKEGTPLIARIKTHSGDVPAVATFSIAAVDPATGELGIAVQSKFLAVGSVVPWAASDAGAIATQSYANTRFGPRGLELLRLGADPQTALDILLRDDPERESRQVGIVDRFGRSATFTGSGCFDWAGGIAEDGFSCQGNILAGADVVQAMKGAYTSSAGPLADRLLFALSAGQKAGGDRRGMQSAALLLVKDGGGYGGFNDRSVDLRVDDHPRPIEELERLLHLHRLYFDRTRPEDRIPLAGEVLHEVRTLLHESGYLGTPSGEGYDEAARSALKAYFLTENFDERWTDEPTIDRLVLRHLREKAGPAR